MNKKIGLFDSGIGGITTLEEIKKLLPNEDYIFYADSKNNPYGEKTKEQLCEITKDIVNKLISYDVKLIVIACNTATTNCIEYLRKEFPDMIFIGTEPAVKVACDNNYKATLLMATPGTISSDRTKELIEKNKKDNEKIYLVPCDGLANAIETNNQNKIDKLLHENLDQYKEYDIDAIVLGCTHYPIIKDRIQKFFPKAILIDGNIGVAKQVKYQLETHNLLSNNSKGTYKFIQTK